MLVIDVLFYSGVALLLAAVIDSTARFVLHLTGGLPLAVSWLGFALILTATMVTGAVFA